MQSCTTLACAGVMSGLNLGNETSTAAPCVVSFVARGSPGVQVSMRDLREPSLVRLD